MSTELWRIDKPAVRAAGGVVVSQHHLAAEAGAGVLRAGGNAVDAAIAAGFAVGVVEPWMSGLGGGGVMIHMAPGESDAECIGFGMKSSRRLDPADYPLSGGTGGDLFAWPAVVDDRNVHGPYSIAVPGQVAGLALAHKRYGTLPWATLLEPAVDLAKAGLEADWIATVRIAAAARALSRHPASAAIYLPGGFVPAGQWGGPAPRLANPRLVDTLECLARDGAEGFYRGDLARSLAADLDAVGARVDAGDLAAYRAEASTALAIDYRRSRVFAAGGLTGGPSLKQVLESMAEGEPPRDGPDGAWYAELARALSSAFEQRFGAMGHDAVEPACTSHISVVDGDGRAVALTQTLLSVFGSKVTLPGTGVMMNNGVMWFDPRPGRPNSIAPDRSPLANMCPVVIAHGTGRRTALGGSGGRRIIGAVAQVVSWLADFGMDGEAAIAQPRIDVSGGATVLVDERLGEAVHEALAARCATAPAASMVYPNLFGCPNLASFDPAEGALGVPFTFSPVSAAAGA